MDSDSVLPRAIATACRSNMASISVSTGAISSVNTTLDSTVGIKPLLTRQNSFRRFSLTGPLNFDLLYQILSGSVTCFA